MKKLIFLSIITLILYSCDVTTVIDGKHPFIVNGIEYVGDGMSEYFGQRSAGYDNGLALRPSVVLPSGLYNIGDTIKISKFIKK